MRVKLVDDNGDNDDKDDNDDMMIILMIMIIMMIMIRRAVPLTSERRGPVMTMTAATTPMLR